MVVFIIAIVIIMLFGWFNILDFGDWLNDSLSDDDD